MLPSTVHNSQHVWLMFDTEFQLFLTHGQFGLDSNDGGSLESGLGSRLDDCGYRQEALLCHSATYKNVVFFIVFEGVA